MQVLLKGFSKQRVQNRNLFCCFISDITKFHTWQQIPDLPLLHKSTLPGKQDSNTIGLHHHPLTFLDCFSYTPFHFILTDTVKYTEKLLFFLLLMRDLKLRRLMWFARKHSPKTLHRMCQTPWPYHFPPPRQHNKMGEIQQIYYKGKWSESLSVMSDSSTPETIPSMEFSRPEYWSG